MEQGLAKLSSKVTMMSSPRSLIRKYYSRFYLSGLLHHVENRHPFDWGIFQGTSLPLWVKITFFYPTKKKLFYDNLGTNKCTVSSSIGIAYY